MKTLILIASAMLMAGKVSAALDALPAMKCGAFSVSPGANGTVRINGVKPKVQKVTFLQQKGDYQRVKIHWVVAATKFSGNYAMDYVNADDKPTMHVEIMRTQQSQIRISGDYDCQPQ
jgi:hypothetical protein